MLTLTRRNEVVPVGCVGVSGVRAIACRSTCSSNVVRPVGYGAAFWGSAAASTIEDDEPTSTTTGEGASTTWPAAGFNPGMAAAWYHSGAGAAGSVTVEDNGKGGDAVVYTPTGNAAPPVAPPAKVTAVPWLVLGGIALVVLWLARAATGRR